jgi:hypothetical protein
MSSRQILLIALLLIAAGLAALAVAAAVLDSEAVMSNAQHIRMVTAANTSWLVFLLAQIPIVWLILTSLWTYRRLLQIPLSLCASVAISLCVGALFLITFQDRWFSLANRLTQN